MKDILFARLPDKRLTDKKVVEAFTGQWKIPGSPTPLTISLRGDHTLVASNPGEPDVELIPKRGTTFDMKGQNGVTIEFKQDASGKVNEAALDDNGTVVVLKRK